MDQLVKLVSEKAGISEDKARVAVEVVLDFLKKKLPAPVAGQIDGVVKGGGVDSVSDVAKGMGNLLDRK